MAKAKAVLVGAGEMGKAWARALYDRDDVSVEAWIDIDVERARSAASAIAMPIGFVSDDLDKALRECRPDFVVDVTTPESHCAVTLAALEAGIPVIGEKPMATSMEEARSMVAASERSGKLYMVSQSRRYDSGLQAYRAVIERELGPIGILNADFYIGAHFGGFRDEMPSPLILDMAIHTFDAARYLSGADPVAVYAEQFNPGWSWYDGDACAFALFEMSGGLRFAYRGSWCAEGCHTSWDADWRAVGPRGSALWRGEGAPYGERVAASGGFFSQFESIGQAPTGIRSGIHGSLHEFIECLSSGRTPMGECHDNIKSLAMVFAAIESSACGRRVSVSIDETR